MSEKCSTCRFAEDAGWTRSEKGRRLTLAMRYPLECMRGKMEDGEPTDPATLAFTMDGSSFRGALLVNPDFGCVQWGAK